MYMILLKQLKISWISIGLYALAGCSQIGGGGPKPPASVPSGDPSAIQKNITPGMNLTVYETDAAGKPLGSPVYSDSKKIFGLYLVSSKTYDFQMKFTGNISNTETSSLVFQQVVPDGATPDGATPKSITLHSGSNLVSTLPEPSDYLLKFYRGNSTSGSPLKTYQVGITCGGAQKEKTLAALDIAKDNVQLSASLSSKLKNDAGDTITADNNVFDFSATGLPKPPTGTNYLCAWDYTGVGIVDSPFQDCSTGSATSNAIYVPFLGKDDTYQLTGSYSGARNVTLYVKDSRCNASVLVQNSKQKSPFTFPINAPALGDLKTFIHALVAPSAGSTGPYQPRISPIDFLMTNQGKYGLVSAVVGADASNHKIKGFTISANLSYGQTLSVPFGIQMEVSNLDLDYGAQPMVSRNPPPVANLTPTPLPLGVAANPVAKITFTTDQAGDSLAQIVARSSACTLSNFTTTANVTSSPCTNQGTAAAMVPIERQITVFFGAEFTCRNVPTPNSDKTIDIKGAFYGSQMTTDSCPGGLNSTPGIVNFNG